MPKENKKIALIVALIIIVGAIWIIEATKPPAVKGTSIALTPDTQNTNQKENPSISATSTSLPGDRSAILKTKALKYPPAVELVPGGSFINSAPFTLKSLIGKKVILVDFWTYSCINCLRTLPYLEAWNAKYASHGLVIVGVHSPEFDFEKDATNIKNAVARLGITYPVVQDNDMATWNAFQNQYWPHEYLIDIDGYIVDDKIGEGGYDDTERSIQAALKERATVLGSSDTIPNGIVNPKDVTSITPEQIESAETYFGSARNEYLGNGTQGVSGTQVLSLPATRVGNILYLAGSWNFQSQFASNTTPGARIVYTYNAKNVYFVASAETTIKVHVLLDGKPLTGSSRGADVNPDGTVLIHENRLYKLVEGVDYGAHTIEIQIDNPSLDAYTFTFG